MAITRIPPSPFPSAPQDLLNLPFPQPFLEPSHGLILRLQFLFHLLLAGLIAADGKPMPGPVHDGDLLLAALATSPQLLDLAHAVLLQREVVRADRHAEGELNLLGIAGDGQAGRVGAEAGVNQRLAVAGPLRVVAEDGDDFAPPAEAGHAQGQAGTFVGAKALEEADNARHRH